ncbi:MAG TPA: NUDIX domain-containing protein [Solirubrobacterales bacterium]|nr:NUDIX domain-containing protein [Solirubrobacterales bacterium]
MTSDTQQPRIAVAVAIRDESGDFLAVKRPREDTVLGSVWGLPAIYVEPGEALEKAAIRVGRQKLGVEVEPVRRIGEDQAERSDFTLRLTVFEARIVAGAPSVPQTDPTITQYIDLKYTSDPGLLVEAARRGSVCSRVFLGERGVSWSI